MLDTEPEANQNNLVGREWLLNDLTDWFESGAKHGRLAGSPGIGKTAVLKEFSKSVPGSVIIDFSTITCEHDWPVALTPAAFEGRVPSLIILDSLEAAPPIVWRSRRLMHDFSGVPLLFSYRPGVHHESLQIPGSTLFELNCTEARHQVDLISHLCNNELGHLAGHVSTFGEAEYLIDNPQQGAIQLSAHYIALWRETTRPYNGATRILMEQVALLLADTPEPLSLGALSDFTGIPSVQILESVDHLSQILTVKDGGLTLFSPGLAASLKNTFSRDVGAVHGRIVSFFRDTYPSWQEMHDSYGWRYLVLHCDRLARASRRQDFSVLHWLNEGSFSQLKLDRTGMLPSVLKDLRLSLLASLESNDLPRIVSFGCRIAKLRKRESVRTVHRLADAGLLDLAQENGRLIVGESQRFLVWLLFATQTLENNQFEQTHKFLLEAFSFATISLSELEVELAAGLIGGMLSHRAIPEETRNLLEDLLDMRGDPNQGLAAYRTVTKNHDITRTQRKSYLERGLQCAARLVPGKRQERLTRELESRLARTSRKEDQKKAYPLFLTDSKEPEKTFEKQLKDAHKGEIPVATLAAALIPISEQPWVPGAFQSLLKVTEKIEDDSLLQHSLSGLLQSIDDSQVKEISASLVSGLSDNILKLQEPSERSRYLARLAVLLSHKGRPLEASQRISLAAANAFGIADSDGRSAALLLLAETVAATGAIGRARDLAFHALELRSRLSELDLESQQFVRLLSNASAQDNQSAEEIVRLGSNLRFEDTPAELEAKGRALVVLASGLSRLGAEHHAKLYRAKAADAVRSIDELPLRVHLLSDLASAFHSSGEEKEARRLVKEARGLFDEEREAQGLLAATALLRAYMVLENKAQTKKLFQSARKFLESAPYSEWLVSQAFLDFIYLSQQLGRVQEVLPTLAEARRATELSDQERLGVLRAEIRLRNFPKAETHADAIQDITLKCHARIDLALALLYDNPGRALEHLGGIPLETFRCEGIRRVALLNSADIRPTQRHRVREVLCQLTLLACEHPDAMDSVLSRWIQSCPDRETIMAIADKMSWSTGAGPMFRQVMESRPDQIEDESQEAVEKSEESSEESVETAPQDDGFRAVSLTNPTEK